MLPKKKTSFDKYVARRMKDAEFADAYESSRAEIDAVDDLVRRLDGLRERSRMSKAELARRLGVKPETLRRLFTADAPNPTLTTVTRVAQALGYRLTLVPDDEQSAA